jgi:hypothetical protein
MNKRHTPQQIVRKLRQAEARLAAGATVPEALTGVPLQQCMYFFVQAAMADLSVPYLTGERLQRGHLWRL